MSSSAPISLAEGWEELAAIGGLIPATTNDETFIIMRRIWYAGALAAARLQTVHNQTPEQVTSEVMAFARGVIGRDIERTRR